MNDQQKHQVLEWLKVRVGPYACVVCTHVQFKVDSELFTPPVWRTGGGRHLDLTDSLPLVVVTCTHCGHARFHSATDMGLVDRVPSSPPSPEPRAWDGQ